jgi:hypothetical protein
MIGRRKVFYKSEKLPWYPDAQKRYSIQRLKSTGRGHHSEQGLT